MLSLVPRGGRICEIGVFAGDFAEQILQECKPSELVLFDLWSAEEVSSGDADGNNVRTARGIDLEQVVRARFSRVPQVTICKGCSSQIGMLPSNSIDAVYVDGDHSYAGVRRDLARAWHVLKDGGWLMGHDYETNPAKTPAVWDFGVKEAVRDFCWAFAESIHAVAMDGQVSFAIRVRKSGFMRRPMILVRCGVTRIFRIAPKFVRRERRASRGSHASGPTQ